MRINVIFLFIAWVELMGLYRTKDFWSSFSHFSSLSLCVCHSLFLIETNIHYRWHRYWHTIFIYDANTAKINAIHFLLTEQQQQWRDNALAARAVWRLEIGAYNGYIISLSSDRKTPPLLNDKILSGIKCKHAHKMCVSVYLCLYLYLSLSLSIYVCECA